MPEKNPLLEKVLHVLDDTQAMAITVLDVQEQTTITDTMIICTGRSSRHVKSIATHLIEQMKAAGTPTLSNNGLDIGDWVLIDLGDVIVHVMQADSRAFYNLEGLWQSPST